MEKINKIETNEIENEIKIEKINKIEKNGNRNENRKKKIESGKNK